LSTLVKLFNPNSVIIEDNGEYHHVKDILIEGDRLFKKLLPNSLVLLLCNNDFESIYFYINCIQKGLVPILINSQSDIILIERIVSEYNPDYVFASTSNGNQFGDFSVIDIYRNYTLFKCNLTNAIKINSNLALLLSTSGTTGSPKLVRLTYENLVSNAKSISDYLGLNSEERAISNLPMNYSFGLSIINSHLFVGGSVVLTSESITQRFFWDLFKKFNVTSLSGVPYTFEIIKKFRLLNSDLPSLKTITQAGGKLSNDLVEYFAKFASNKGIRFFIMYGQTEGTARLSYLAPKYVLSKLGSIGKPIPNGKFYIIDEQGATITEPNVVGELVYVGANVMLGYSNNKFDLAKGDENSGVLNTGDLAKFDEDGFYFIVGRIKRFIKIFGNRVNLDEIEALLFTIGVESACFGNDNSLFVCITNPALKDFTKNFIFNKLGIHYSAFEIRVIDFIPKNNSGKTLYSKLTE
jgi:long-chain acyl-CoA synthetase